LQGWGYSSIRLCVCSVWCSTRRFVAEAILEKPEVDE
jgi:hypothetical protein